MNVQPCKMKTWKSIMTKRLTNAILWLGIWCFYAVLGCIYFRANSSPNGLVLNWSHNYSLKEWLSWKTSRITQLFPHGVVEFENKEGVWFKVKGHRIEIYLGHVEMANELIEAYHLDEVWVIKCPTLCCSVKSSAGWEATQYVSSSQL